MLEYFRRGVVHYQCVLIALASDLSNSKSRQGQHKFWRYVSPLRTYFAWLPKQLALTYCRAVLEMQLLFFLDYAARVITTVAVIELC